MKQCSKCKTLKELKDFFANSRSKNGKTSWCKLCIKIGQSHNKEQLKQYHADYYAKNKDKIKSYPSQLKHASKDAHLRRTYGIQIEEYNRLLTEQDGVCAVCQKTETTKHQNGKTTSLCVDHCHSTGRVRGLLCRNCNGGIGKLQESAELLRKAAEYLERNKIQ